jgi:4-carboxymuconolactone decarboxylase
VSPDGDDEGSGERYRRGLEAFTRVNGPAGERVLEGLQEVAPDFARSIVEFAYGDVYSRPGLDLRTRQLLTVATLAALGTARPQLRAHIQGALNVGCSRQEIVEAIMHVAVFAGFPAALNGLLTARDVFANADARGTRAD